MAVGGQSLADEGSKLAIDFITVGPPRINQFRIP